MDINKTVCKTIIEEHKKELKSLLEPYDERPKLAIIQVGNNQASNSYIKNKMKVGEELGIDIKLFKFEEDITEEELYRKVAVKTEDHSPKDYHGVIVQLPLPEHLKNFPERINYPPQDVDGFNPYVICETIKGNTPSLSPCTPKGILHILDKIDCKIEGKHVVVVGRSLIVGKPVAHMLLNKNATVTIAHSRTENLKEITKMADILIVAVGVSKLIGADHVKPGAVVIDVGINRDDDGKLCGDVNYEEVRAIADFTTPVPGGVGPMTVNMLMENTIYAFTERMKRNKNKEVYKKMLK